MKLATGFAVYLRSYRFFTIAVSGPRGAGKTAAMQHLFHRLRPVIYGLGMDNVSDFVLRHCGRERYGNEGFFFLDDGRTVNEALKRRLAESVIDPYSLGKMAEDPAHWMREIFQNHPRNRILTGFRRNPIEDEIADILGNRLFELRIDAPLDLCAERCYPDLPPEEALQTYQLNASGTSMEQHCLQAPFQGHTVMNDGSQEQFVARLGALIEERIIPAYAQAVAGRPTHCFDTEDFAEAA